MIKPLLSLKNSLLFNKAVFDFWFQSTHDYANLVNDWLTSAVGLGNLSSKTEMFASTSKHFVSYIFIELPVAW